MVTLQHIQQVNDGINWKCGAVCLEMIFNYYGKPCNQDDIWDAVKTDRETGAGQKYAYTTGLVQYAMNHSLNCTMYRTDEDHWSDVLDKLDRLNVPAILSVKEPKSGESHFMVYLGKKDPQFVFADPNSEKETDPYNAAEVREMWSPHPEINVTGFIYMVFEGAIISHLCRCCSREYPILGYYNSFPLSSKVPFSNMAGCPYCYRPYYYGTLNLE